MRETAPDLVALALDAHGGVDFWNAVAEVRFQLRVRGNILAFRGRSPRTRHLSVALNAHRVHARLAPFPHGGLVGVLDEHRVRIEAEDGRLFRERTAEERAARQSLLWDDLDELYFLAYSFWNYATTPFLLSWPGFHLCELPPVSGPGGPLHRLRVRFPTSVPTHCPEQTFYFGPGGLLRRLDYTADAFGPLARGAHLCRGHRTFSGLVVPTRRRVVPRLIGRRTLPWPSAMEGYVDGVEVVRMPPAA